MSLSPSTPVSRQELEIAFKAMCTEDKPNLVKIDQLKLILRALGYDPRNSTVQEMSKNIRDNRDKLVGWHGEKDYMDVDELWAVINNTQTGTPEEDKVTAEMRSAFKLFDIEGKGYITVDNLKTVARELGESMNDAELEEMIQEATGTSSSRVDEKHFFDIMKKTCLY